MPITTRLHHLQSLLLKSMAVQAQIDQEQRSAQPDIFRLLKLKKTQLTIKDHLRKTWSGKEMALARV